MRTLVVGVGSADRGDDVVGLVVADHLARRRLPGVTVRSLEGTPLGLLTVWPGWPLVVVVDALRATGRPGAVRRFDATDERLAGARGAGSHDASLVVAIELARALDRLPARLVVYGVTGGRFGVGDPPSPVVLDAAGPTADLIADEVAGRRTTGAG